MRSLPRTRFLSILAAFLLVAAALAAQAPGTPAAPAGPSPSPAAAVSQAAAPRDPSLPPSEQQAKGALEKSPRHGEWVDVKLAGSAAPVKTWVVYPERKDKAGVVIVIHEIYGASDWIRGVADQHAREGYIAVAPDLISGRGPGGGGTDSVASRDEVVRLIRELTPEETQRYNQSCNDH